MAVITGAAEDFSVVIVDRDGARVSLDLSGAMVLVSEGASVVPSAFTSTVQIIDSAPPENRMLSSKSLCILRPEYLAYLDFLPLAGGGISDSNTRFYNARVAKRKMQLESSVLSLNSALDADYDNYIVAKTQYESSLAAAAAEIALLKIAYLFKVYAQVGPSFTSFIDFYNFNINEFSSGNYDMDAMGTTFSSYMNKTMSWSDSTYSQEILQSSIRGDKDGAMFVQLINDLSFSCAIATPYKALDSPRFANSSPAFSDITLGGSGELAQPNTKIYNVFSETLDGSDPNLNKRYTGFIKICRDLTASVQIGKIVAADGDEDETLKAALEKYVAADYFTSTVAISPTIFKQVVGWDPFAKAYKKTSGFGAGQDYFHYLPNYKAISSGLLSEMFSIDQLSLLLSKDSDEYQSGDSTAATTPTATFSGVESIVDAGFAASDGIDLRAYSAQISKFQDNLEDVSLIFKQLFRLLDKRGSILGQGIAQNSHPTSPLNMYATIIELMNNRYWKKFPIYLGLNPSLLKDISGDYVVNSEEFYKCWGIHFILNFPDLSKKILEKLVDDYNRGFLTFSDVVNVVEVEITTGPDANTTYEVDKRDNVYPGTSTVVDLSGQKGGLYSYLQAFRPLVVGEATQDLTDSGTAGGLTADLVWTYFQVSMNYGLIPLWQPNSPTKTFCGTLNSEEVQALAFEYAVNDKIDQFAEKNVAELVGDLEVHRQGKDSRTAINLDPATSEVVAAIYGDAKILYTYQQACCMWQNSGGVEHPAGIIPVAGCVIDAVMSVLYTCLAPILDIETGGDTFFPAVESLSPPYHTQTLVNPPNSEESFKYIGGLGSFTSINTDQWVPVLNAITQNLARSEDKTMLFSGADLSSIIGGVVDAIAAAGEESSNMIGVSTNTDDGVYGRNPSNLEAVRPADKGMELQIPQWGDSEKELGTGVASGVKIFMPSLAAGGFTDDTARQSHAMSYASTLDDTTVTGAPMAEALFGASGTYNQNTSILYATIQNTELEAWARYKGIGTYLFANFKNPESELYKQILVPNALAGAATPSQFLDKLTTTYNTDQRFGHIYGLSCRRHGARSGRDDRSRPNECVNDAICRNHVQHDGRHI